MNYNNKLEVNHQRKVAMIHLKVKVLCQIKNIQSLINGNHYNVPIKMAYAFIKQSLEIA